MIRVKSIELVATYLTDCPLYNEEDIIASINHVSSKWENKDGKVFSEKEQVLLNSILENGFGNHIFLDDEGDLIPGSKIKYGALIMDAGVRVKL